MLRFLRIVAAVLVFASFGVGSAEAACQLITATLPSARGTKRLSTEASQEVELCHSKRAKGEGRSVLEGRSAKRCARRCTA